MAESVLSVNVEKIRWRQYLELCKPKVVLLIVFTAVVGMLLSTPGAIPLQEFVFGTLGIGLAAASGAAVNHWVDQRIDLLMERTQNRPLPTGGLSSRAAITFALGLCALSMVLLVAFVNNLTALLTLISMIGYAVVYTMFLKRNTPHNIVLGAPLVLPHRCLAGQPLPVRSIPRRCYCS